MYQKVSAIVPSSDYSTGSSIIVLMIHYFQKSRLLRIMVEGKNKKRRSSFEVNVLISSTLEASSHTFPIIFLIGSTMLCGSTVPQVTLGSNGVKVK